MQQVAVQLLCLLVGILSGPSATVIKAWRDTDSLDLRGFPRPWWRGGEGGQFIAGGLPPGVSLITTSAFSFSHGSRSGDKVALAAQPTSSRRRRRRMTNERLEEQLRLLVGVWGSSG